MSSFGISALCYCFLEFCFSFMYWSPCQLFCEGSSFFMYAPGFLLPALIYFAFWDWLLLLVSVLVSWRFCYCLPLLLFVLISLHFATTSCIEPLSALVTGFTIFVMYAFACFSSVLSELAFRRSGVLAFRRFGVLALTFPHVLLWCRDHWSSNGPCSFFLEFLVCAFFVHYACHRPILSYGGVGCVAWIGSPFSGWLALLLIFVSIFWVCFLGLLLGLLSGFTNFQFRCSFLAAISPVDIFHQCLHPAPREVSPDRFFFFPPGCRVFLCRSLAATPIIVVSGSFKPPCSSDGVFQVRKTRCWDDHDIRLVPVTVLVGWVFSFSFLFLVFLDRNIWVYAGPYEGRNV